MTREETRQLIEEQTAKFLADGGKIKRSKKLGGIAVKKQYIKAGLGKSKVRNIWADRVDNKLDRQNGGDW